MVSFYVSLLLNAVVLHGSTRTLVCNLLIGSHVTAHGESSGSFLFVERGNRVLHSHSRDRVHRVRTVLDSGKTSQTSLFQVSLTSFFVVKEDNRDGGTANGNMG